MEGAAPTVPLWQVDAFTDRPWAGNPAGVCVLDGPAPPTWMQSVAAEVNAAETAFVHPSPSGSGWALRWFTPTAEIDLCGHATLATAHVLLATGRAEGELRFATNSGPLRAWGSDGHLEMDFPAMPAEDADLPADVAGALGRPEQLWTGRAKALWLIELPDPDAVVALRPEMGALAAAAGDLGVSVTARDAGGDADFVSRYFVPGLGIPEDPVTGSAHCALAPHWAARLGRDRLRGHQLSARGGVVDVALAGDRVGLGGQAVTVFTGAVLGPDA